MEGDITYLGSTKSLCSVITLDSSIEKTKKSDDEWNYRYIFEKDASDKILRSAGYGIVYFQNDWRFILYLAGRL